MQEPEANHLMPVFHQNRYAAELDCLLAAGAAWLDIGAGHRIHDGWLGPSCDELAERTSFFAGCDVGKDIMDHPHLHDARIADAAALPWADAQFDLVTANMVAEHLDRPQDVLREVFRVLKPGGRFLFVTPNLRHPVVRVSLLLPRPARRWFRVVTTEAASDDVFPTYYRLNTITSVKKHAQDSGLELERIEVFRSTGRILPSWLGTIESAIMGLAFRLGAHGIGSNLICVLRKPLRTT